MLPVARDLLAGVEKLNENQVVCVEARHLRAVGIPVAQEKKWVTTDPETGEGDYQYVDVPDKRPMAIKAGDLRARLSAGRSNADEPKSEASVGASDPVVAADLKKDERVEFEGPVSDLP